ncbi:hypothetical protein [Burkholderia gladioli]|uniref:hypothetical protein n=1 Tax=Burkholderia gladioli TaxID=28095 RepID=UPI00163EB613|nr:hypothetical protein [Burkholderia gladioli]
MTPDRAEALLQGQTAIAKKVYEAIPIQESWALKDICSALTRVTKSTIDMNIAQGCIGKLCDAGLVREASRGRWQRVEVRARAQQVAAEEPARTIVAVPEGFIAKPDEVRSPITILSEIAIRLGAVCAEIKLIAADIENAALEIEGENAKNDANLAKLRQLQGLLRELS